MRNVTALRVSHVKREFALVKRINFIGTQRLLIAVNYINLLELISISHNISLIELSYQTWNE